MDWFSSVNFNVFGKVLGACLLIGSISSVSLAAVDDSDDGDTQGYEQIINQLNRENNQTNFVRAKRAAQSAPSANPLDDVKFHAGVGYATLMENLDLPDGSKTYMNQKGVQAAFGIDLFSHYLLAEGTVRSFGPSDEQTAIQTTLQEFELKVIYHDHFSKNLGFRFGGGLSARYLTISGDGPTQNYTTPTAVATMGVDFFANDFISFGVDLNGRDAMVSETIDHSSVDATLRLDTHF
jgi:hypothetical protein